MTGVLFRVFIPTSQHEIQLRVELKYRILSRGNSNIYSSKNSEISSHKSENHYSNKTQELNKPVIEESTSSIEADDVFEILIQNDSTKLHVPNYTSQKPIRSILKDEINVSNGRSSEHQPKPSSITSQHTVKQPVGFEDIHMEKVLKMILKSMHITSAVWCVGEDTNYFQVMFSMDAGNSCEEVLRQLTKNGIGSKFNSIVSVSPCCLHYHEIRPNTIPDYENSEEPEDMDYKKKDPTKVSEWDKFVTSVRARLTVAQVVQGVKSDANITFDFLTLLLIAALLSALGLVENSTEILVASMLISPLMGPIMAGTFGTMIRDHNLQKVGFRNELLGLLICLIIGYLFGLSIGLSTNQWGNVEWPTEEMTSRGRLHSVWVGVLVALFSGAAVAIATLGDYTGSLVGVAISAALLPPAVNAGLLWSLACTNLIMDLGTVENSTMNYSGTYVYSEYPPSDLAILGAVSVCLTLINILCIFLAGILVLKIKEVAPQTSKEQGKFWKHDVRIARDYNRTLDGADAKDLGQRFANEISGLNPDDYQSRHHRRRGRSLLYYPQEIFNPSCAVNGIGQLTWSPSTRDFLPEERPSVQELEVLYRTLTANKPQSASPNVRFPTLGGTRWFIGSPSSNSSHHSSLVKNSSLQSDDLGSPGLSTIHESRSSNPGLSTVPTESPRTYKSNCSARFTVTPAQDPIINI